MPEVKLKPTVPVKPKEVSDGIQLAKMVFLAYTDVAAGGSRALLGLDMRIEYHTINIPELSTNHPACVRETAPPPTEQDVTNVQLLNCKYEQDKSKEYSLLVVNTIVPAEKCHYVCNKLMDLCTESGVEKLVVLTALRLENVTSHLEEMYENTINDKPLTKLPALPGETRICDQFLSTLIQMIQVEHQPTSIFVIPSHKVSFGRARADDGAQQVIIQFQDLIQELTGLRFSREFSFNMIYRGDSKRDHDIVSSMYS